MNRAAAQVNSGGAAFFISWMLAASLAGCGGSQSATRHFDSREILPLRDSTLELLSFTEKGGDPTVIYSTMPAGAMNFTYWSLDVATGNVESLGTEQPASITAISGPYSCYLEPNATGGAQVLDIFDRRTEIQTQVDQVISYAACPGSDGALTVFRADPTTGSPVLWQGPFAQLQPVSLSMDVESVGQWLFDTSGALTGVLVAAATTVEPAAFGLYTLDLGSTTFTEDVPATPASTAWATGAAPAGSLQSNSLATGAAQAIRTVGDHFVYARTMSDGGTTMFAGPFGAGPTSELALFQADPKGVSTSNVTLYGTARADRADNIDAGASAGPTLAAWSPTSIGAANTALMVWDDVARAVVACPSSAGAALSGVLSPDGSRALFAASTTANAPAVTLLSLPAGGSDSCLALAAAGGTGAGFSGDGQALFWTIASGSVNSELWAAAADGSDPRMIGSGALSLVYALPDPGSERLEFYLDSDFVWVDLRDNPIVLHDVVQQVFEGYYDFGSTWLLIGYDFSTQDGSGMLGLVDRDTGATRSISPAVTAFRAALAAAAVDGGATDAAPAADAGSPTAYDVIYVVRGRNPSPQDGFWIARINASDLQ